MSHKIIPIYSISKKDAQTICGSMTQTSKMPCKSYSLPTESCQTGYKMAQIKGSICASCYADKGFYKVYANTIKPAQFSRLDSVQQAIASEEQAQVWVSAMVSLIGKDGFFRWHDSGDLQGVDHLALIASVAQATPHTRHWLPTREYAIVKEYLQVYGSLPENLIVRLSAMYPDQPVKVPASLSGVKNVTISNVHTAGKPATGQTCKAPEQDGACADCRLCWSDAVVSYALH